MVFPPWQPGRAQCDPNRRVRHAIQRGWRIGDVRRSVAKIRIGETAMAIIIGDGEYRYEVIENWGKLPDGWRYGEVAAVGVDSKDNFYVFSRSQHPMTVFDREGNFLR